VVWLVPTSPLEHHRQLGCKSTNPSYFYIKQEPIWLTSERQWLSFSPVASTAATFFSTNESIINWLSTAFLFAFVVASPATIYALYSGGPRLSLITASLFILLGNWIRYAGTRSSPPRFGVVMFGQILTGLAQPFVLSAPTQYSDIWFTPRGRVSATAIASLANPFGGALGQLINPFLCSKPSDIPSMTLYVAIISSLATIPTIFLPCRPPTPVAPSSSTPRPTLSHTLHLLTHNPNFWLLLLPFSIYVGLFNSLSSLLPQILTPYAFSLTTAGIAGALLIIVGLLAAAISSPLVDRSKRYLLLIKTCVPIIAACDLIFIWAPGTRSVAAPYIILAVLGAANFSVVPVALEWVAEVTFPAGPEASSTLCWVGGQLLGALFILISDALKAGKDASPPFHMGRALVFQAVVGVVAVLPVMLLGLVGKGGVSRLSVDKAAVR
jgi:FLVCR family MFS transporter 7